jgi:hypothetical protein
MEKKITKLNDKEGTGKLSLKRESIRTLTPGELEGAVGGIWGYRWSTGICKVYDTILCW